MAAPPVQPLQPVKPVQPVPQDVMSNTRDLFVCTPLFLIMPLSDNQRKTSRSSPPPRRMVTDLPPPCPDDAFKHRPSTSRHPRDRPPRREKKDVFADPPGLTKSATTAGSRDRERRPRRNSESSIMERPKLLESEEERRRRERRRREREARHRDGKSSRSKKNNYHMDIIDKLDVTSIYGTGSKFSFTSILDFADWFSVPPRWSV